MSLEKRIEKLEEECNIKHGCILLIMVSDGIEGPTNEEVERYREQQRESGQCENCGGMCVLDWPEKPRKIQRQQSIKGSRGMAAEGHGQGDVLFVIGKGYINPKEH